LGTEIDVWRAANALIRAHGAGAALAASLQADALLAEGDIEGQRVFVAILKAIAELVRNKPIEGEAIN
jgi:hypothetical protein